MKTVFFLFTLCFLCAFVLGSNYEKFVTLECESCRTSSGDILPITKAILYEQSGTTSCLAGQIKSCNGDVMICSNNQYNVTGIYNFGFHYITIDGTQIQCN